jgi:hypothetical protein
MLLSSLLSLQSNYPVSSAVSPQKSITSSILSQSTISIQFFLTPLSLIAPPILSLYLHHFYILVPICPDILNYLVNHNVRRVCSFCHSFLKTLILFPTSCIFYNGSSSFEQLEIKRISQNGEFSEQSFTSEPTEEYIFIWWATVNTVTKNCFML